MNNRGDIKMKKILVCLLAVLSLFILTGCKKDNEPKKVVKKEKLKYIETKVEDYDIVLSTETKFNELSYKAPENANIGNVGTYSIMDIMNNDSLVVRVAMYYFEGKYDYEVMKDSPLERVGTYESNKIVWTKYTGYQDDKYLITLVNQYNNSTYTITFLSDYDIEEFIDKFTGTIEF